MSPPDVEGAIAEVVEEAVEDAAPAAIEEAVEDATPEPPVIVVTDEPAPLEEANDALALAAQIRQIAREEATIAVGAHEATYPHSGLTVSDVVDIVDDSIPEPEPEPEPAPPRDTAPKNTHWMTRTFGKS